MSNAKRFLSVILAIIMVCSTLVIGANAAYVAYKDQAMLDNGGYYNAIDQAVLTTEQYASAAMDEIDRMLDEEQLKFTRADIFVGDIDLTSVDRALDDAYAIVNGNLFNTLKGMLGDLKDINVSALRTDEEGGARRKSAAPKTDLDVFFAVFQFLFDNKTLLTRFIKDPTFSLGSIVEGLVDVSEFKDVSQLLKGLLYEVVHEDEDAPKPVTETFDDLVQELIDNLIANEIFIDDWNIGQYFTNTNISSGTFYDFIDTALKDAYNGIGVPVLNTIAKEAIGGVCGAEYITEVDPETGMKTVTYDPDNSELNEYARLLNVEYEIPEFEFTDAPFFNQLNNIIKTIGDALVNPDVFVWQSGSNAMAHDNIVNLGKAALINTGDDFFASYIEVASPEEVEEMDDQQIAAYALRAIINASVDEMYIPAEADTIRKFGYYTLSQLLATAVPELDFSELDPDSTETLVVMGIDYAIYSIESELDMGLEYIYDMDGVNEQLRVAAQYGIDNYGGLFSGIEFTTDDDGWSTIEKILFRILDQSWLPAASNGSFQTFLIDNLINNILDLDFEALLGLLDDCPANSELLLTPKKVVINRVASILNTILPGAIDGSVDTIEAIGSNAALGNTLAAVIDALYYNKEDLAAAILPTLCSILDLTNPQEFEFPSFTYDKMISCSSGSLAGSGLDIKVRNNSTGINTGYTDANGEFHQDSIYTYRFNSVTVTPSSLAFNIGFPETLAGGQTGTIRVSGNCPADTAIRLTVSYDVLTEDGSELTTAPISEDIYFFAAKSASNDLTTNEATTGNVIISKWNNNFFKSSVSGLTDIELTVENTKTTEAYAVPVYNMLRNTEKVPMTEIPDSNGVAMLKVVTEPVKVPAAVTADGKTYNGLAKIKLFETTEAYDVLTKEEKAEVWNDIVLANALKTAAGVIRSYPKFSAALSIKNEAGTSYGTGKTTAVFLYKEFGLGSILESELTKHRQASGYKDAAAWAEYQAAMLDAVTAAYGPFTATTFANFSTNGKSGKYEPAYNRLTAAIEALDECASGAGVESTQAIIDMYNPASEEGAEYDDPGYTYFGVADYKSYTYYNYRDEYKSAQNMIDRFNAVDEEGNKLYTINELDKAYIEHRLSLYGKRLLPVEPTKIHLDYELASLTRNDIYDRQDEWTAESWANFERALAFAEAVSAEDGAKQSKINRAIDELLEAEKRLVAEGGEVIGGDATFELVEPTEEGELAVVETADGTVLTGISGAGSFAPEAYFDCTGCTAQVTLSEADAFGTGAVVEIVDDASGNVIATYYIAVYADLNGDASTDINDLSIETLLSTAKKTASSVEKVAADMNLDDGLDINDLSIMTLAATGKTHVDCVARETY